MTSRPRTPETEAQLMQLLGLAMTEKLAELLNGGTKAAAVLLQQETPQPMVLDLTLRGMLAWMAENFDQSRTPEVRAALAYELISIVLKGIVGRGAPLTEPGESLEYSQALLAFTRKEGEKA